MISQQCLLPYYGHLSIKVINFYKVVVIDIHYNFLITYVVWNSTSQTIVCIRIIWRACQNADYNSGGLVGPKSLQSNCLPGDGDVASLWTILGVANI